MVHFYMGTKGPENVSLTPLFTVFLSSWVNEISDYSSVTPSSALLTSDLTPYVLPTAPQPQVEVLSEEEGEEEDEEEDILSLAEEKYRPAALEKMIALIALLVEQSRSERYDMDAAQQVPP